MIKEKTKVTNSRSARSVPLADVERHREEEQETTHEVYFLYTCNRIKIGTSRHAQRRIMQDISPCCPAPCVLLGTIRGGQVVESRLHRRFDGDAIGNEWFEISDELHVFICEDDRRAKKLKKAQDDYRRWLRVETVRMERDNEGPPHQPGGAASRQVQITSGRDSSCISIVARQDRRLSGG